MPLYWAIRDEIELPRLAFHPVLPRMRSLLIVLAFRLSRVWKSVKADRLSFR